MLGRIGERYRDLDINAENFLHNLEDTFWETQFAYYLEKKSVRWDSWTILRLQFAYFWEAQSISFLEREWLSRIAKRYRVFKLPTLLIKSLKEFLGTSICLLFKKRKIRWDAETLIWLLGLKCWGFCKGPRNL